MKLLSIVFAVLATLSLTTPAVAGGLTICDLKPKTRVVIRPIVPSLPVTVEANANDQGIIKFSKLSPSGVWEIVESDDQVLVGIKVPILDTRITSINCIKLFDY